MPEKITKPRGYKTIKLPCSEEKHAELLVDYQSFKGYVDAQYREHPELFSTALQDGYESHGFTEPSKKNLTLTDSVGSLNCLKKRGVSGSIPAN